MSFNFILICKVKNYYMIELNYNLVVMKMFKFLLIPFGVLYYLITSIRNKFYDYKLLKSISFKGTKFTNYIFSYKFVYFNQI